MSDTDEIIDECTLSEWYIAHVFSHLYPNKYKYEGTRHWSFWDLDTKEWKPDINNNHIKNCLRYDLSIKVLQRAKFWQEKVATRMVTDMHMASLMIQRLLTISQKLQTEPFIRKIVRELQEHYCS